MSQVREFSSRVQEAKQLVRSAREHVMRLIREDVERISKCRHMIDTSRKLLADVEHASGSASGRSVEYQGGSIADSKREGLSSKDSQGVGQCGVSKP